MTNFIKLRKNLELAVIKKAHEDKAFEKLLLSNPLKALKELGVSVPENMKIEVIEESGEVFKFVYPKATELGLTDVVLASVAAGTGRGAGGPLIRHGGLTDSSGKSLEN